MQKPKFITYRDYKNYNHDDFCKEVNDILNLYYDEDIDYNIFFNTFLDTLNRYAPKKQKHIRAYQCNFMDKEIKKTVTTRSRLRNKYLKNRNDINVAFNKQRNLCTKLQRNKKKNTSLI